MAKHKAVRYGICNGVNLLLYIPIPTPTIFPENFFADLAIRIAISCGIAWITARIMGWHHN